jgi:hypothetical protein
MTDEMTGMRVHTVTRFPGERGKIVSERAREWGLLKNDLKKVEYCDK